MARLIHDRSFLVRQDASGLFVRLNKVNDEVPAYRDADAIIRAYGSLKPGDTVRGHIAGEHLVVFHHGRENPDYGNYPPWRTLPEPRLAPGDDTPRSPGA